VVDEKSDPTLTFTYTSLATTVTIKMEEEGDPTSHVAQDFTVPATVGATLSYNAPNVPGWRLTNTAIQSVSPLAGGASEIVFTYAKITSKVTIVHREHVNGNDTDPIIKVTEVANPVDDGTPTDVLTPDLTDVYYLARQTEVTYEYNGTDPESVNAFYDKELVDITVNTVNRLTGISLAEAAKIEGQRRGDIVTVAAPAIMDWQLVGPASQKRCRTIL
jgi:hypothetical protein